MKKNVIIVIILGSLLGYFFGFLFYRNYDGIEELNQSGNIYYVQYGVYTSMEAASSNTKTLNNFLIQELDDKYYVYLGITTTEEVAFKIQKFYQDQNIHTYIRNDYIQNSSLLKKIKEYDQKIQNLTKKEEIQSVVKELFANEEITYSL